MSQKGSVVFRVLAAVILVSVMVGGVFMAYQAGQAQGYALGTSGSSIAQSGTVAQPASPVPFYPGMMGHHFYPFMGFFGIIPMLIGLLIVLSILKHLIFGFPHRGFCRCNGKFYRHPFWYYEGMEDEEKSGSKTSDNSEKS